MPGEPLIFVEVALVRGLAEAVEPLLAPDTDTDAQEARAREADTAIFYSISNCQEGLRGVSFGNFLIKQVVEELKQELPRITRFATFRRCRGSAAGCNAMPKTPSLRWTPRRWPSWPTPRPGNHPTPRPVSRPN